MIMGSGKLLLDLVLVFIYGFTMVYSTHFRGGIIMARPQPGGMEYEIEISYHISWRRSRNEHYCNSQTISRGNLLDTRSGNSLTCQYWCEALGIISSMSYTCTSFSVSEDWTFGERSLSYDFASAAGQIIAIGFTGRDWIAPFSSSWNISTTFSVAVRNDTGRINSTPRAITAPVIRLREGCNHTIALAVSDPDGDTVRCRKAEGRECAGICNGFPGSYLDSETCVIEYEANRGARYWAAAIMIEDFIPGSPTPLSSVALQFLILVISSDSSEACSQKPTFIHPTIRQGSCVAIPPGATFTTLLVANSTTSDVSITEIQVVPPLGTLVGQLTQSIPSSNTYYVNVTWTPSVNQQNQTHMLCFTALGSDGLNSDQTCIDLLAGFFPPAPISTTLAPNEELVYPSNTTWHVQFDTEIVRPSVRSEVAFHSYTSDEIVYRIDPSVSPEVTFGQENNVSITPNFTFGEKTEYYITFDRGVVQGIIHCGPGNEPITDKNYWTFVTIDVTPPVVTLLENASVTNTNASFSWESNENVTWECLLVHRTVQMISNCSEAYWRGYGLTEGVYHLEIRATDEAGNVGTATHTFTVDTTPPASATFVNVPSPISNNRISTLSFSCSEICSFECGFESNNTQTSVGFCDSGEFTTPVLQSNTNYTLSVIAIDQVGNRANSVSYAWVTDFEPPQIVGDIQNATAVCENSSPENTGQAQAIDNRAEEVSLMYRDTIDSDVYSQCYIKRTWAAIDAAGNVADLVQFINLDFSPVILLLPQVSLPCDSTQTELLVSNHTASAPNHCGLEIELQLTYQDSEHVCPGSFVRNWTVVSCGRNATASQAIILYDLCPADACGRNESTPRGICSLGECQCNRPWYGEDCDTLIYDPVAQDINDTTLLEAQEYVTTVNLSQGTPPLVWSLISGPENLTVNQYTGDVRWSRAKAGNYVVVVQIENQVNSTQIEWTLKVIPGYNASLLPISQAVFPYAQPIALTGYVEFSPNNFVESYLGGVVPVQIDIISNGSVRSINAFSNSAGNFSVTFFPTATEYGMYFVGARHPSLVQPSPQEEFGILGMKSIPREIALNGEGIRMFEHTFYNATVIYNDGPGSLSGLTAIPILPNTTEIEIEIVVLNSNRTLYPGEQLSMDIRVVASRLLSGTFLVSVDTREGTTLQILTHLQLRSIIPSLLVDPSSIDTRIIRGSSQVFQFNVTNIGRATASNVRAILPDVDLISFVSFGNSQQDEGGLSLETGDSALLTLLSQSAATQQFGVLEATIVIASSDASTALPIKLTVSSNVSMNLTIVVEDEYTYFAGGRPLVNDAIVTLVNDQRNINLMQSTDAGNGTTTFYDIYEDYYEILVEAPSHLVVRQTVLTSTNAPVLTVFIQRRTVTYSWSVTPTTFRDVYAISIEADFETRVPIPVVTVTPHEINLDDLENNLITTFQINITNHGLIRADDVEIRLPSHPRLIFSVSNDLLGHLEALSSVIVSINSSRKSVQKRNTANSLASGLARAVNWVTYQINIVHSYVCNEPLFRTTSVILKESTICSNQLGDFVGRRSKGCRTDPPSGGSIRPSTGDGDNSSPTSPSLVPQSGPRQRSPSSDFTGYSTVTPHFCNPCISSVLGCLTPSPYELLLGKRFPYAGCIPAVRDALSGNLSPIMAVSTAVDLLQCTVGTRLTGLIICAFRQNVFTTCLGNLNTKKRKKRTLRTSINEVIEALYPIQQSIARSVEILGDETWLSVADPQWLSDVLRPTMDDTSEAGVLISLGELSMVLSAPPPNGTATDMVASMVNRINNTISGWNNGTLEPLEGSNMASFAAVQEFSRNINNFNDIAVDKGFSSFVDAYNFASSELNQIGNFEEEVGVCAVVRIRIQQELAITRESFIARLEIDNLEDSPLEEIFIDITIIDLADGTEANHVFAIGNSTLSGSLIESDSGKWSLASETMGAVEWLIIPYSEAAPDSQHIYTIGGSFSYIVNGENITVPLFPTPIVVSPDASLIVHYFLEKTVIADDPFTDDVELSIPFTLGIAVQNAGYGTAYDFRIASSQPEIIDNERGLLVDFMIIGANIGNERASPSLNVMFGDLPPNSTVVARWYMISSLQGEFSRYSATFENRNPLGDPRLSILDDLQVHELIRNVMLYTPNEDDDILDFLVNDRNDYQAYPDALYSSKTLQRYSVSTGSILSVVENLDSMAPPLIVRTSSNSTGWVYYRYEDTQGLLNEVAPAVNGTKHESNETVELPPVNSWITRDRNARSGAETFYLHILDYTETTDEVVFMLEPCTLYCPVLGLPFSRPTVKLPIPFVDISVTPPGMLYAATTFPLTLTCNIEFDSSLTESVNVSVAWLRGTDPLSNATERVSIFPLLESSSAAGFISTLRVFPLLTNDSMDFTCRARIIPIDGLSSTTASDFGEATVTLFVQEPTVTPVRITATSNLARAGDLLNVTCSATITPSNLISSPVLSWSGPGVDQGSVQLFNGTSDNELILSFSPLLTSHGGDYVCNAMLSIPEAGVEVSVEEMLSINVSIPPPRLTIAGFPQVGNVFQGLDLTLTCSIEVDSAVDSSFIVHSSWQKNETYIDDCADGRITISNVTIVTPPYNYQTALRFNPIDLDDAEVYTCTVTVMPQSEAAFITGVTASKIRTIANISSFPAQNVSVTEEGLSTAGHPNYTLLCTTSREPLLSSLTVISVRWLAPHGDEVSGVDFTDSGIEGSENGVLITSRLIFHSVMTSQAGDYTCRTVMTIPRTDVLNYTVDQTFTVTVKLPSPITVAIVQSREDLVYEGTAFTLLCMLTLNTTGVDTEFEVERNFSRTDQTLAGDRITLLDTVISDTEIQMSLMFYPVTLNDSSTYECSTKISSMYPNVTASDSVMNDITLTVFQLPEPNVTIYSTVSLPTAGENHRLVCYFTTVDFLIIPPVISWSSSVDISDANVTTVNYSTSALTFNPLHTSHGGLYTCEVRIDIPQADILGLANNATENIRVQIPSPVLTILSHPVPYNGTLFTLSGVAHLDSNVDTNVTFVGIWTDSDIPQVITLPPYQYDLNFQPLSPQSSKEYTLDVTIRPTDSSPFVVQSGGSISYNLTVQPLPPRPPNIVVTSRYPSAEKSCGVAKIVNCTANAVENLFVSPIITWISLDGYDHEVPTENSNPVFNRTTGQLIFSDINAENSGLYVCHAVVNISESRVFNHIDEAFIAVKMESPAPVTDLMCNKSSSPSELTILWEPPIQDFGEMVSYLVKVKEMQSKIGSEEVVLVDITEFNTDTEEAFLNQGLTGMVPYEIRVKAISVAGCGEEQYLYCFTQEGVPLSPNNVTVSRINLTAIIVTWEKQSLVELKGLADYIVEYTPVIVPKMTKRQLGDTVHVPWTENHVVLSNLMSGVEYNVYVSSSTSAGISDPVQGVEIVLVTPPSSSDGGIHNLGAIIAGVVLVVLILCVTFIVAVVMLAFMVNKPKAKAVYKPTTNRSELHNDHSTKSKSPTYHNPSFEDVKYAEYLSDESELQTSL